MAADYVDAEHLSEMIDSGAVEILPKEVSLGAQKYLDSSFPLSSKRTTSILDWDTVPSSRLNWMNASDEETAAWAANTVAGRHRFAILLYTSEQPCLLGPFDFMVRNLDELVWKAPGCRILFGVDRDPTGAIVFSPGIIEYDGKTSLIAST